MRGRKPKPTALKLIDGNPGKRPINANEPKTTGGKPTCPSHLSPTAKSEWKRISGTLHEMGILTAVDRAALAAYCQAYARWVDAEKKLAATPPLIKTPSGYVQQSPWLRRGQQADGADGPLHGRAGHHAGLAQPHRRARRQ